MAVMIPKEFPHDGEPGRWAEEQTFTAFSALDEKWVVLYSWGWQSARDGKQGDGEADFVLLHPNLGIFVAEVKGGSLIEVVDNQWFTFSKRGGQQKIKNPFEQATTSKHTLIRYLKEQVPRFSQGTTVGHFVVFPSHTQQHAINAQAPRDLIIDENDLVDPASSLMQIARHWETKAIGQETVTAIRRALVPHVTLAPSGRAGVTRVSEDLDLLTQEQIRAFQILQKQRRVWIQGGAGTGKTILATARASQLATAGFRTLLVCFNQPLANKLKKDVETLGNVTATTFHALCGDMINRSGLSEIITIDNRDEYYTHILPEWLPDAAQKLREKFDAVIVDEGQDFLPHWMTALEMLLTDRNDSVMAVFGDSNQAIFTPGWEPPFDTDPVELSINCRNTRQIAERIKATGHGEVDEHLVAGLPGSVSSKKASSRAKAIEATIEGARELRDQFDFGPSELTVLASSRALVSALIDSDAQEFSETPTQNQTLVETIHRFKGLENEGILLALDPEANTDDVDRLGYVGMSRARQVLRIIASKTDLQSLSWD